jgi:PAS domain S-box-containing protein
MICTTIRHLRGVIVAGSYDYRLVALSVLVAILASYTALDLGARVTASRGRARLWWMIGGATSMGIGIWSMHYIGMLAFSLPVPVVYDWPTVLLSLLTGILASGVALFVVSRSTMGWLPTLAGGILQGGGIAALHYLGMASMRMPANTRYSPALVTLSVVLAIAGSLISLWLIFFLRDEPTGRMSRRAAGALLMGVAIATMHYTAIAGVSFSRSATPPDLSHSVNIASLGSAGFVAVSAMVPLLTLLASLADGLEKQRVLLHELFEQAPQAVALTDAHDRVARVNKEFTRIFGYSPDEAAGKPLSHLIAGEGSQDEVQEFADLVARGHRVDAETVRQRKDGSSLQVSVVRVPVSIPGEGIAGYAIYGDITATKGAERELQDSLEQLRALAARLHSAREEERSRVAREIHDDLGQALTAIKIDFASLLRDLAEDQGRAAPRSRSILNLLDRAIQSVRRIGTELRPGILDDLGLVAALEWAAEDFQTRTGTKCEISLPDLDIPLDPERATALFRIFQETLTNVARHAEATRVQGRLCKENGNLILEVGDNGKGISDEQLSGKSSLGILGMRERVLLLGGTLTISSTLGNGTTVRVLIPDSSVAAE